MKKEFIIDRWGNKQSSPCCNAKMMGTFVISESGSRLEYLFCSQCKKILDAYGNVLEPVKLHKND